MANGLITPDKVKELEYSAGEDLEDLGFTYNTTFLDGILHGSDKYRKYVPVYHKARLNRYSLTLRELFSDENGVCDNYEYFTFIAEICNIVPEYKNRFITIFMEHLNPNNK